jgi:aryl carrier-like protein
VLKINEATLITYDDLLKIGVDSVEIIKLEEKYLLDFKDVGTFEDFIDS